MASALSLRNLVKTFANHRAVDDLSLEIAEGTIFGLLGPNGAGKTTTIRMIMDIIRPDSGAIEVLGSPASRVVKSQVGYLPEERNLYRKMTVLEVLTFLGTIKGASIPAARDESRGWLEELGLPEWGERKFEELSKGMQQKVQFVAAVLGKPRVLVLDEPFSGMDPVNQDRFKDVILGLNREGRTIVFSTHQMDTAEKLCHEIALIHRGKVVLAGTLGSVKSRFGRNAVQVEYEGDGAFLRTLPGVAGVDEYAQLTEIRLLPGADPQALLHACVARLRIRRFEVVAPTLHNVFLEQVKDATTVPVVPEAAHA